MNEGYLPHFKMQAIKVDKSHIETYTDEELKLLLKKPNLKKCSFTEYQCWVITNFLFSTGVRQRSLMHIQIKDLDFDNNVVHVNVTKNIEEEKQEPTEKKIVNQRSLLEKRVLIASIVVIVLVLIGVIALLTTDLYNLFS